MGTRATIEIRHEGKLITSKYYQMDGHVENWAGRLIAILNDIPPEELLKMSRLFQFMNEDRYLGGGNDWDCDIDIVDGEYEVTVEKFGETVFSGSLAKFDSEYNFL